MTEPSTPLACAFCCQPPAGHMLLLAGPGLPAYVHEECSYPPARQVLACAGTPSAEVYARLRRLLPPAPPPQGKVQ